MTSVKIGDSVDHTPQWSFSGPTCASCTQVLPSDDQHDLCFRNMGAEHAGAPLTDPVAAMMRPVRNSLLTTVIFSNPLLSPPPWWPSHTGSLTSSVHQGCHHATGGCGEGRQVQWRHPPAVTADVSYRRTADRMGLYGPPYYVALSPWPLQGWPYPRPVSRLGNEGQLGHYTVGCSTLVEGPQKW